MMKDYDDAEEFNNMFLKYKIVDDSLHKQHNKECFEAVKKALKEVGVYIKVDEDHTLSISINGRRYLQNKRRSAGRRYEMVKNDNDEIIRYSDVVLMLQSMTDTQIYERLNMSLSTYYRHKKKLMNSDYYKSLDKNRLNDEAYLRSITGNFAF